MNRIDEPLGAAGAKPGLDDCPAAPATIMQHVYGAFSSLAMLAAMQLDLFTPLEEGPLSAGDLVQSLGVKEEKLAPLLYSLAAADLLERPDNRFVNTAETAKYLVRGRPDYMGGLSGFYANLYQAALKTAESVQTGGPRAKLDWSAWPSVSSPEPGCLPASACRRPIWLRTRRQGNLM